MSEKNIIEQIDEEAKRAACRMTLEQLQKAVEAGEMIHTPNQGMIQISTPFTFPDGDGFQIYLKENSAGSFLITDYGHTMMHLSYENEVSVLQQGNRGKLFEQILAGSGLVYNEGEFQMFSGLDSLGANILQFGQTIARLATGVSTGRP